MAIDSTRGRLYVSGGRVNDWSSEVPKFSGLYSYDIATKAWSQLPWARFFNLCGILVDETWTGSRGHRLRRTL